MGLGCIEPAFADGYALRDAATGHWRYDLLCLVSYRVSLPLSSFNEHQASPFFRLLPFLIRNNHLSSSSTFVCERAR